MYTIRWSTALPVVLLPALHKKINYYDEHTNNTEQINERAGKCALCRAEEQAEINQASRSLNIRELISNACEILLLNTNQPTHSTSDLTEFILIRCEWQRTPNAPIGPGGAECLAKRNQWKMLATKWWKIVRLKNIWHGRERTKWEKRKSTLRKSIKIKKNIYIRQIRYIYTLYWLAKTECRKNFRSKHSDKNVCGKRVHSTHTHSHSLRVHMKSK